MKPDWEAAFNILMDYWDYKAAFNILMDYWDYIPEEEHIMVDKQLRAVLGEQNDPLKPLSQTIHTPPPDCIKKALKHLRDQYGFGIPNKKEVWKKDPIVLKALVEEFKK